MRASASKRAFRVVLIKPSHYDQDGYVIQWLRSTLPSNSLASVYGLIEECARDRVLGPDVDIEVEACDECNTIVDVAGIAKRIRATGGGMVGLIGVQSNQFPRALDLGRQFRAHGLPVVMGGFHVSGCISMLPDLPADLKEALDLGITLFAGEAEGRMAEVLRDVAAGNAKPIYNYLNDLPEMAAAVYPILPRAVVTRVAGHYSSFDAGRGCPFQCSFCTIINVQGRKSRYRTPDDVEAIVRANAAQGITRFFITDDNFARNRNWEPILDRLIELREREGFNITLLLQVDTLCHRIPGFIEKSARAGCTAIFLGLENINPELLMGAKKRQNKIWEYREMLLAWRAQKVMTYAGYILGFPDRYAGIDRARHRDHQEGTAGRHPRVLLSDAAAGLGGSQEAFHARGGDGPRHEQIRSRARLHRASVDVEGNLDAGLCRCVDALLHRRACRDHHAPRRGVRHQPHQNSRFADHLFRRGADRRRASAAVRVSCAASCARSAATACRFLNPLVFYPWRVVDFLKVTSQWLRLIWRYRRIMARVRRSGLAHAISTRRCGLILRPARPIISSKCSPTRSRTPMARRCGRRTSPSSGRVVAPLIRAEAGFQW